MERSLGVDLAHVRVHRDSEAADRAARENAHAFAAGRHVGFAQGAYRPGTIAGDLLLAHELAHVVQQDDRSTSSSRSGDVAMLEAEADEVAAEVALGERSKRPGLTAASPGLALQRCAVPSGTLITPEHFQFQEVVPYTPPGPGGWRAALIHASMSQGVKNGPPVTSKVICKFETGVPIYNHEGFVNPSFAKASAAAAANTAAYAVLSTSTPVTSVTCVRFRKEMERLLKRSIKGARVSAPVTPGLPPVPFPP